MRVTRACTALQAMDSASRAGISGRCLIVSLQSMGRNPGGSSDASARLPPEHVEVQVLYVDAIGGLGEAGGLGVGARGVLQVGDDLAVLAERDHVAIALRQRPERAR